MDRYGNMVINNEHKWYTLPFGNMLVKALSVDNYFFFTIHLSIQDFWGIITIHEQYNPQTEIVLNGNPHDFGSWIVG